MHIGNHIRAILESMPRQYTVSWFATAIHCDRRNVYYIFERPNIDTGLLLRISQALGHNFFRDLAGNYEALQADPAATIENNRPKSIS